MAELLQFVFSGLTVGAIYASGRARFHADLQGVRHHQFRAGRVRDAGRNDDCFRGASRRSIAARRGASPSSRQPPSALALHRFAIEPARGATSGGVDHDHDRRLDLSARHRPDHLRQAFPQLAVRCSVRSDPVRRRGHFAAKPGRVGKRQRSSSLLLWLFIDRTMLGKAVIATAANRLAARLVGVDTRRIVDFSFAVSAAIGAIAGVLITPIALTSYDVGTLLALKGFAAAMLGGIGSASGRRGRRYFDRNVRGFSCGLFVFEL